MPTYSYRCQACGVEFDVHQAFTDSALTGCEGCGGALRKLFSAVGVTFNGSGFYRTDSRAAATASEKKTSSSDKKKTPSESSSGQASGASNGSASGSSSESSSSSSGSSPATPSTPSPSTTSR